MGFKGLGLAGSIEFVDLAVQGAEVVGPADSEKTAGEEPDETGAPFSQIEAVNAEVAQEGLQDPRDIVVVFPCGVVAVGLPIHAWNEEEVDDPTNEKESSCEQPNHAGDWAVRSKIGARR